MGPLVHVVHRAFVSFCSYLLASSSFLWSIFFFLRFQASDVTFLLRWARDFFPSSLRAFCSRFPAFKAPSSEYFSLLFLPFVITRLYLSRKWFLSVTNFKLSALGFDLIGAGASLISALYMVLLRWYMSLGN